MKYIGTIIKILVLCCLLLGGMSAAAVRITGEPGAVNYAHCILATALAMLAGIIIYIKRRIRR